MIWGGPLCFCVTVDGMNVVSCEVVGDELVDLGVMALGLDSSFGGCFCLELGGVDEWTSGGVVSMVDLVMLNEVHVLNIFIGFEFEEFFHNFCDGGRFLKE